MSSNDQLQKIHQFLGNLIDEDFEFIEDSAGKQYAQSIKSSEPKDLFKIFHLTDPKLVKILGQLLEFNPKKRISAERCLKNSIFDKFRVTQLEKPAPC